jgi:hypothetical protein
MTAPEPARERTGLMYAIGILGAFFIVGALAWAIHVYTRPAPLGEDRVALRSKALSELRAAEADALNTPAWIDPAKGIVRLRIEDAMKIVEREWGRDAAAGRSNLISRVQKATALPPKAPEAPSQFE